VITAHVAGLPLEETVLQLAPAAAATLAAAAVTVRAVLGRLLARLRDGNVRP
jgi:hypothetical protein